VVRLHVDIIEAKTPEKNSEEARTEAEPVANEGSVRQLGELLGIERIQSCIS